MASGKTADCGRKGYFLKNKNKTRTENFRKKDNEKNLQEKLYKYEDGRPPPLLHPGAHSPLSGLHLFLYYPSCDGEESSLFCVLFGLLL